ncbi:LicD family protein [Bradyrhizobium sp. 62]|uniref:LicD family protein n=1 Tax=Bradyrhizobium sp. 62 TaxID=1043588 RepID=UPI001FFA6468|nr:LicD family protein [Bradyrhizobium sp. 62]MCK1368318.1 LicD family protein [Bradyrhizobium sp. 62]
MNLAAPLFDSSRPAIRTSIAGISNARYEQLTDGSKHIYRQVLTAFDHFKLEYYLFAGAIVGYVRNGRMPPWNDDLDVILFEDQIEFFESKVVPALREAGYECWPVADPYTGGGYHILALQQDTKTRDTSIELARDLRVKVPWAQVDVFYTKLDEAGLIRNLSSWGMYHKKQIPEGWVKPGTFIHLDSLRARVFSKYEEDIMHEYGNVGMNIVVHSHDKVALKLMGTAWSKFEFDYEGIVSTTVGGLPPSLDQARLAKFIPDAERSYEAPSEASLDTLANDICAGGFGSARLTGEHNFWAMDLKRLFPEVKLEAQLGSEHDAKRAVHLRHFIDQVRFSNGSIESVYGECLRASRIVAGHASGG